MLTRTAIWANKCEIVSLLWELHIINNYMLIYISRHIHTHMVILLLLFSSLTKTHLNIFKHLRHILGMHLAIDIYNLILRFDLKFFVCRHVSIWGFWNRVCLSVRLSVCITREKKTGFVNISPTLVIDASMGRSSRVIQHGNIKEMNFLKKCLPEFFVCHVL